HSSQPQGSDQRDAERDVDHGGAGVRIREQLVLTGAPENEIRRGAADPDEDDDEEDPREENAPRETGSDPSLDQRTGHDDQSHAERRRQRKRQLGSLDENLPEPIVMLPRIAVDHNWE